MIKNQFASFFFKEISGLNYVYLNHVGTDVTEIPTFSTIDLLVDREDYASLLYVITSFPHIRTIRTKKAFKTQYIQLRFADESVFSMKLLVALNRMGTKVMDAGAVLAGSRTTADGIRVPSAPHRFEYHFINAMISKEGLPEAFCHQVKGMSAEERTAIFGHLVSRYRFVIHLLDDLFSYQRKYRVRVKRTIRSEKPNRKIFRMFRSLFVLSYWTRNLFGAWKEIHLHPDSEEQARPLGNHIKAFLMKKAAS